MLVIRGKGKIRYVIGGINKPLSMDVEYKI